MVSRLFLVYVVAELAVVVALASTIGLGWTVLVLLAAFALGLALAGSQLRAQVNRLRADLGRGQSRLAADSVAGALGTLLVVIPGLVTRLPGPLLLLPPTRAAAPPLITVGGYRREPRPDYVDGEVIDITEVDPPALGPHSRTP